MRDFALLLVGFT